MLPIILITTGSIILLIVLLPILIKTRLSLLKKKLTLIFKDLESVIAGRNALLLQFLSDPALSLEYLTEKKILDKINAICRESHREDLSIDQKVDRENQLLFTLPSFLEQLKQTNLPGKENIISSILTAFQKFEVPLSNGKQSYNTATKAYNSSLEEFPSSAIAGKMGFQKSAYFEHTPRRKTGN